MSHENIKNKTLSAVAWQFLQKFVNQFLSFIVTVILARLLMPSDYGVVALASMFNVLAGIFIGGGMSSALIQKNDADELDYNTVFYSSLMMSFIIYAIVFFGSPIMACIYDNAQITPVMRTLALTMPIGALSMVQDAKVSKKLEFKKFFTASLSRQLIAAAIGISMAYLGFGPWALVAQQIFGSITNTFVMYQIVRWHPRRMYSWERFKILFSYAWKKLATGFIGTLCVQLKGYLIGARYTTSDLAFYNRGEGLPAMFSNNISGTIDAVLFPALASMNDDISAVKRGLRRAMMTSSYILTPIFLGLCAVSGQIVPLLYSNKWSQAIPFMQVACLTECIVVLNKANLLSIHAIGRPEESLKLEFRKKPVMILLLLIAVFISPIAISIAMFVYSFYVLYMNTRPNAKYLNYSLREQINDVKPAFILGATMSAIVYGIGLIIPNAIIALCFQIPIGIIIYLGISHLMQFEAYMYCRNIIHDVYNRKVRHK